MQIINHTLDEVFNLRRCKYITLKCDFCQGEFQKGLSLFRNAVKERKQDKFYCSRRCGSQINRTSEKCNCANCGIPLDRTRKSISKTTNVFCSHVCSAIFNNKLRPKITRIRKLRKMKISCLVSCENCQREISRTKNETKKCKNGKFFCSKSCRMIYQNLNCPSIKHYHRSSAEDILCGIISKDFPDLEIIPNSRKVLTGGLEIDIFIPSMNLAIELNGPVHYMPIYGDDRLKKVQDKDARKQIELQEMRINLIVVDISRLQNRKNTEKFLQDYYDKYIKPILV